MSQSIAPPIASNRAARGLDSHPPIGAGVPSFGVPMETLSLELELQSTDTLVNVLTVIARLRGEVAHLLTRSRTVRMAVLVPSHVAHRVGPLLMEIIGVVSLETLANAEPEEIDPAASRGSDGV